MPTLNRLLLLFDPTNRTMKLDILALVLLAILLCRSSSAATFTAVTSGNWKSAATWGNVPIPGDGDTVDIKDGVTISVTDATIIGASGVNGTTAVNTHNTGALVIAAGGTLQLRGDIVYTGNNYGSYLTVQGGGVLEFDSSHALSAAATQYTAHQTAGYGFRSFVANGTSNSHAIVRSNPGGGNGSFSLGGFPVGGAYATTYTDFIRIGDAVNPAFSGFNAGGSHNPINWIATHDTFTSCGLAPSYQNALIGEDMFQHDYNVHIGSVGATVLHRQGVSTPRCTAIGIPNGCVSVGVREMIGNVFDIAADYGLDATNMIISGNYFSAGVATCGACANTNTWSLFQNNFYRAPAPRNGEMMLLMGDARDNVWFLDDALCFNPHGPMLSPAAPETLSGNIVDHFGQITMQTSAFLINNVPLLTNGIYTEVNNILLPNAAGHGSFWLTTPLPCCGNTGETFWINHNTIMIDSTLGGCAVIDGHSNTPNPSGSMASYQNNILWNPSASNQAYKIQNIGTAINSNICDPVNCDYNVAWNMRTDGGGFPGGANGYADAFRDTPGLHDLVVNPMFLDATRNTATFDSAYLGYRAITWDGGSTYNIGDMVSSSEPSVYNGARINYRYTNGKYQETGSSSVVSCGRTNTKPGLYTDISRACWELATLYHVRQSVGAGTSGSACPGNGTYSSVGTACLFDDQAIGAQGVDIITALIQWIRAGFSPTAEALALAGSDGQDIGAVPVTYAPSAFPHLRGPHRGPMSSGASKQP